MKIVNGKSAYTAQRCLSVVFLMALSGCVSAVSDDKNVSATLTPATTAAPAATAQATVANHGQKAGYVDPAMVSAQGARAPAATVAAAPPPQGTPQVYGQAPQISGLSTQPTGISASSLSIYANSQPVAATPAQAAETGSVPAYAPAPKVAPALNSVYSAPAVVQPPANTASAAVAEQHSASAVPVPVPTAAPVVAQAAPTKTTNPVEPASVPIAAFFASAAKKRGSAATAGFTQVAALPGSSVGQQAAGIALNGRASMTDEFDDTHVDEDDKPAGLIKLASLSGLSRISPNGLLVQTEQVNVGCFKPEMIKRIKEVEAHYRRPAMVTSGYRPPKATTQGSKHYTCDAADIQVSGVTKWDLANYLRSLPDRGGVGTYCHTESVHMDLGEPRDWNWRCRRTGKTSNSL